MENIMKIKIVFKFVIVFLVISSFIFWNLSLAASQSEAVPIGEVVCLFGVAEALDAHGNMRILMLDDVVYSGERVIAEGSSYVCVRTTDGQKQCVGRR
jgi:hypothetical protein